MSTGILVGGLGRNKKESLMRNDWEKGLNMGKKESGGYFLQQLLSCEYDVWKKPTPWSTTSAV